MQVSMKHTSHAFFLTPMYLLFDCSVSHVLSLCLIWTELYHFSANGLAAAFQLAQVSIYVANTW